MRKTGAQVTTNRKRASPSKLAAKSPAVQHFLLGAVGGLIATGPMTAFMKLMHRRLPWYERYPLPPRQITMRTAKSAGLYWRLNEPEAKGLTLLAHYSYGAAMGALYSLAARQTPRAVHGMLFGMVVWAGNYLGLLPALNLLQPATRQPARRNLLMIAAHLVWGASLAWSLQLMRNSRRRRR
jgi:uncharacterized membrane protein YagU involved in acid resistance